PDPLVERDGQEQADEHRAGDADEREVRRIAQRLQERLCAEQLRVVVEADERRARPVLDVADREIGEAERERREDRRQHEDDDDRGEWVSDPPARDVRAPRDRAHSAPIASTVFSSWSAACWPLVLSPITLS